MLDTQTKIHINPTGRFVVGGPMGDAGLTGPQNYCRYLRRLQPSRRRRAFGQRSNQGGSLGLLHGALRGEESGGCRRRDAKLEVQIAYAIGVAEPVSVMVDTFGTGVIPDPQMTELIRTQFQAHAARDHRNARSAPPDLPPNGDLWTLWTQRARFYLGTHRQGCENRRARSARRAQSRCHAANPFATVQF